MGIFFLSPAWLSDLFHLLSLRFYFGFANSGWTLIAITCFGRTNRARARELTYALAASFQEYSKRVKENEQNDLSGNTVLHPANGKKKFAIDLRLPEEMHQTIADQETEA